MSTLYDVEAPEDQGLAFQNFGGATIASDLPAGRIDANSASANTGRIYRAEQRFGASLSSAQSSGGALNLDSYTGYFDVDTATVLNRCVKTLAPREDYVTEVLAGVPDLYGPFWVPTTLIFSLFLTSSLYSSIGAYLAGSPYTYDFTRLGAAVSLVYTYHLGLPVLVWAALKYWAGVHERNPVEIISLYGYASTVWILVSWLTLIPYSPLRVLLVLLATVLSLTFLVRNLYPVLSTSTNSSSKLLIVAITVLHLALGLGLWFGFMAGGHGALDTGAGAGAGAGGGALPPVLDETTPGEVLSDVGEGLRRWLFV